MKSNKVFLSKKKSKKALVSGKVDNNCVIIVRSGGIEISYASQLNFIFRLENVSRVMGKSWLTPLTEKQQLELSTRAINSLTLKFCFNWPQANIFELGSKTNLKQ